MLREQIAALRKTQIPAGAIKITSKKSPTEVYLFDRAGKPYMKGYAGNAQKPTAYYWFKSTEKRAAYIKQFMTDQDASFAFKQGRKDDRKAKLAGNQETYKIGDVLYSSWGYDQTNIDYYEVIELFGKRGIVIREIGAESVENGFMQGQSTPAKGRYVGQAMRKTVNEYGSVRITSFASASKLEPIVVDGVEIGYPAKSWTAYA